MKALIQKILKVAGVQIKRYPEKEIANRMKIVRSRGINVLLDVGANAGQYAREMRDLGYKGGIVSFEPVGATFEKLKMAASEDRNWQVNHYALGDIDSKSIINVAGNSFSSSILEMDAQHLKSAPETRYISSEEIVVRKMDSVFGSFVKPEDVVMVKVDTQGYEKKVLDGGLESLRHVTLLQLEMSLVTLYESEMLFFDMIRYLDDIGFRLLALETGFSDPTTGQLLQVDGLFERK